MESQCNCLEQTAIVEKITEARWVAYTRFSGVQEIGRQIWLVRDWIANAGYQQVGYPSCVYDPVGCDGAGLQSCLCEVQWDLRTSWSKQWPDPVHIPAPVEAIRTKYVWPERVLSILHRGDTQGIEQTIVFLEDGLHSGGYQKCGPRREIYRFDVHHPKSRWVTEIQVPVIKSDNRFVVSLVVND
jgi:hypothetical protein